MSFDNMTHTFPRKNCKNSYTGITKETVIYEGQNRWKQLKTERTTTFQNQTFHQKNIIASIKHFSSVFFQLFSKKCLIYYFQPFYQEICSMFVCALHVSGETLRISSENLHVHNQPDCLLSPSLLKMLFYIFLSFPLCPRCWEVIACCQCQCFVEGNGSELIS